MESQAIVENHWSKKSDRRDGLAKEITKCFPNKASMFFPQPAVFPSLRLGVVNRSPLNQISKTSHIDMTDSVKKVLDMGDFHSVVDCVTSRIKTQHCNIMSRDIERKLREKVRKVFRQHCTFGTNPISKMVLIKRNVNCKWKYSMISGFQK